MRWLIEQCFEDGEKHLGIDHYELRSWPGWNRHMTYVFIALLFLLQLRLKGLIKIPSLTLPQALRLLVATIIENVITVEKVIKILKYYTIRNYTAYLSHKKSDFSNMSRV